VLCGGLLAAMKKMKRLKEEGECRGERILPASAEAALPGREPAWAASVWPGGRRGSSLVFCV